MWLAMPSCLDPATPLPGCGAGCVGGIVLSLVWMVVLRYGAGVMAWLTIVAVNAAMISCTMLSYEKAGALHQHMTGIRVRERCQQAFNCPGLGKALSC